MEPPNYFQKRIWWNWEINTLASETFSRRAEKRGERESGGKAESLPEGAVGRRRWEIAGAGVLLRFYIWANYVY